MTVLAGLLILAAVLIAAALAVLGTIAAVAEIFPPWFGRGEEGGGATGSASGREPLRGGPNQRYAHARLIGHPRRSVRTGYPRGSV
jgi:hypothetical protein